MTDLSKADAITGFCELADLVADKAFRHSLPADCFCDSSTRHHPGYYHFDSQVMDFILEAVHVRLDWHAKRRGK